MEGNKNHTLFITGGAGYVGAMLCDQFSQRDDVKKIIALDKEPLPDLLKENKKVVWVSANTSDGAWQEKVREHAPDVVIHTAWQIRELYGHRDIGWKWNVDGSNAVFDFAFGTPSVKKLIYFSTASIYGAYADNTFDHLFKEDEPMREIEYSYGLEKKQVEEDLKKKWETQRQGGKPLPQVFVVRPAAITGPRGRFMRLRFGLQSALGGKLKGDAVYRIVTLLVSFVPATKGWVRQFIHEDDVNDIVALFSFNELEGEYEVFNITPPGKPVFAPDMAEAVGKKTLPIQPWMARVAYFFFWHVTRGKIPTTRGSWRFYSYPIIMDGSKLTRLYGYAYQYDSMSAFRYTHGRYEKYIPDSERVRALS